jgi:hypothetical protein
MTRIFIPNPSENLTETIVGGPQSVNGTVLSGYSNLQIDAVRGCLYDAQHTTSWAPQLVFASLLLPWWRFCAEVQRFCGVVLRTPLEQFALAKQDVSNRSNYI